MKKTYWLALGTLLLATMTAAVLLAPAGAATGGSQTRAAVMWFGDPDTAIGSSHLTRTDDGVAATFSATGLAPREALTLWWVVFNDPSGCTEPCGEDDIFVNGDPTQGVNLDGVAAADIVVGYAAGAVANRNGEAAFTARLDEDGSVGEVLFGTEPTLKDAMSAEIHLVARSHGPGVATLIDEQTGSYAGGCVEFLHPPTIPSAVGECADVQFAIHLP